MVRLALAFVLLLCVSAPAAHGAVPRDFFGTIVDGPMLTDEVDVPEELALMDRTRVGTLRFSVYWDEIQPERDGPMDFDALDAFVAETGKHGFELLPVVLRAPPWARQDPKVEYSSPSAAGRKAYGAFLTALVERYGPGGSFTGGDPIRQWQVWNEPNGPKFWFEQPGLAGYVKLLRVAAPAIREADPRAKVVLAGLFGRAWEPLRRMYEIGARGLFDTVAINPFTQKVSNLMLIARLTRNVMNKNGDRRLPLVATEISYPSAKGKVKDPYGFEVTERGQAQRVRQSLTRFVRARKALGITGVYWSTWLSRDAGDNAFGYAGLRRTDGEKVVNKPAFFAFRAMLRRFTSG